MTDPFEVLKNNQPEIEVDPLLLTRAKETLMSEIANQGNAALSADGNGVAQTVSNPKRRLGSTMLVRAAVVVLAVVGVGGAIALSKSGGQIDSANDDTPKSDTTLAASANEGVNPNTEGNVGNDEGPKKVVLETPQVRLTADSLTISIDGDRDYVLPAPKMFVSGDPGISEYTTLEVQWVDKNSSDETVPMRMYLYFAADEKSWWLTRVATYNGEADPDWISAGDGKVSLRNDLGSSADGNIEFRLEGETSAGKKITGILHFENLDLQAFIKPKVCIDATKDIALVSTHGDLIEVSNDPEAGYVGVIEFVDTSTCEVEPSDLYILDAEVANPSIAEIDSATAAGRFEYDVRGVGVGTTAVTITATNKDTGEIVDTLEVDVTVVERQAE